MRSFTKIFRDWLSEPLPPAVQSATGLQRDQDFAPPEPGFWQTLFAIASDGRIYTMSPGDRKRLPRPVYLRSERALRNEEIAARARAARARGDVPITIIGGREYEPALPEAVLLPAAPRPQPDFIDWDGDIVMPPGGAGDGGGDK
jgi:hypothetical protein